MSNTENATAIVGIEKTTEVLAKFYGPDALRNAEWFVDTLPDAPKGIYYIDYPCDVKDD